MGDCIIKDCFMPALPGEYLCRVHMDYYHPKCRECGTPLRTTVSVDRGLCFGCWRRTPEFKAREARFMAKRRELRRSSACPGTRCSAGGRRADLGERGNKAEAEGGKA